MERTGLEICLHGLLGLSLLGIMVSTEELVFRILRIIYITDSFHFTDGLGGGHSWGGVQGVGDGGMDHPPQSQLQSRNLRHRSWGPFSVSSTADYVTGILPLFTSSLYWPLHALHRLPGRGMCKLDMGHCDPKPTLKTHVLQYDLCCLISKHPEISSNSCFHLWGQVLLSNA